VTALENLPLQTTLSENCCLAPQPAAAGGSAQRLAQAHPPRVHPFARTAARLALCSLLTSSTNQEEKLCKTKAQPLEATIITMATQIPGYYILTH